MFTPDGHDFVPSTMTAESPKAVVDAASGTVYAMDQDISVLWGSSVLWGATAVWGPTVFAGSTTGGQPIVASLDSSIVWSSAAQDGFSVLWSSDCSVLWGSGTVVGERKSALWGSGTGTSASGHKSALWGSSTTGGKKSSALWGADVSEGDPTQP